MDDTKTRIIQAAIKGVRQYGLEGVRIQNISKLAGLSPGAMYRYFGSKDELLKAAFTWVDMQAADIFENLTFSPQEIMAAPLGTVKKLWQPYFRFWIARPDETVFYYRFRDSEMFPVYDQKRDASYFKSFAGIVHNFITAFPNLSHINRGGSLDLLWLHVLTSTLMYAKYVVEGTLPNDEATEEAIFQLLVTGLTGYLTKD